MNVDYSKHCQDKNACGFRKCPYPPHRGLLETLRAFGGGGGWGRSSEPKDFKEKYEA